MTIPNPKEEAQKLTSLENDIAAGPDGNSPEKYNDAVQKAYEIALRSLMARCYHHAASLGATSHVDGQNRACVFTTDLERIASELEKP